MPKFPLALLIVTAPLFANAAPVTYDFEDQEIISTCPSANNCSYSPMPAIQRLDDKCRAQFGHGIESRSSDSIQMSFEQRGVQTIITTQARCAR